MSAVDSAIRKVKQSRGTDLDHFISAMPTQIIFRQEIIKGVTGNATGMAEYIGFAPANASLNDPFWMIKKLIYDSSGFNIRVVFADGTAEFTKVMSSYASYTYSES